MLGQETTGPGGLAYGLRTVPVAVHIAERVAALAPEAWVINFTNPAGMVTEAMQQVLGDRVIGICDSPIGLGRRAARALGARPGPRPADYVGAEPPGLAAGPVGRRRSTCCRDLLADDALLESIEEGRLFGAEWLRALGALPNEYLYYYYFTRDAVASIRGSAQTRGEFLLEQQHGFYDAVAARPAAALATWDRVRARARRDVHGGGARRRGGGAGRRPTSRAAATRAWRWRSWRPSPGTSGRR